MTVLVDTMQRRETLTRYMRPGLVPPGGRAGIFSKEDRYNLVGLLTYTSLVAPTRGRPWRGQRSERFYIEAMDLFGRHAGYTTPAVGGTIAGQTGAPISRTLSGLVLKPGDWESLDLDAVRFRPVMVIDDVPEPLGVFAVVSDTEHRTTRGTYLEVQCQDLNLDLQDVFDTTFNVHKGFGIGDAIADILDGSNVYDRAVVAANPTTTAHLGQPIGSVKWDALDKLTKMAGLTAPWRDRTGVARVVYIPYVGVDPPVGTFEAGDDSPIIEGTNTRTRDRWHIPNTWLVIGRADDGIKYAGRYTLPDSHPLSVKNRRRTITKVVELAGIDGQGTADARARDQAQTDVRVHDTREFDIRADPTLEPWDIRTHDAQDWLLDSWSHELRVGRPQHVKLRESVLA